MGKAKPKEKLDISRLPLNFRSQEMFFLALSIGTTIAKKERKNRSKVEIGREKNSPQESWAMAVQSILTATEAKNAQVRQPMKGLHTICTDLQIQI